jgi:hypothetical protein
MNKVLEAARIATLAPDPVVQAARIAALSPSLGYPDTKLITCNCTGGALLPHHERCPMRVCPTGRYCAQCIGLLGWKCACGAFNGEAKEKAQRLPVLRIG